MYMKIALTCNAHKSFQSKEKQIFDCMFYGFNKFNMHKKRHTLCMHECPFMFCCKKVYASSGVFFLLSCTLTHFIVFVHAHNNYSIIIAFNCSAIPSGQK